MVEPLLNVPQLKVIIHLTFNFADPKSTICVEFPPCKIFLSLVFKFTAPR
jgi:hypothetical protein